MSDTNLTPEQAIEKINEVFNEKSASFSTKEELEATTTEMKSQIDSLKGMEEKSAEIEKAIARIEGRFESFNEKASVSEYAPKSLGQKMFDVYAKNIEAIKGAGSVTFGIALMQDYDLVVTEDSINLIKELNNYSWLEKKSKTPIDKFNHLIDAIRMSVSYQLQNPNRGKYYIQ